tara:strand:- start:1473 stop:1934 length:462 start_codon:yes stop_codon:yes gene_type:complete
MGLDCYIVHGNDQDKAFTHEDDERLKDISLCGGMLSGSGSDGSFRGKAYEPLMDDLMSMSDENFHGQGIWHKCEEYDDPPYVTSDELKAQAKVLEEFIQLKIDIMDEDGETYDDDTIVYQIKDWAEYTLGEVKDLATLLGIAGKRGAIMHVWW